LWSFVLGKKFSSDLRKFSTSVFCFAPDQARDKNQNLKGANSFFGGWSGSQMLNPGKLFSR